MSNPDQPLPNPDALTPISKPVTSPTRPIDPARIQADAQRKHEASISTNLGLKLTGLQLDLLDAESTGMPDAREAYEALANIQHTYPALFGVRPKEVTEKPEIDTTPAEKTDDAASSLPEDHIKELGVDLSSKKGVEEEIAFLEPRVAQEGERILGINVDAPYTSTLLNDLRLLRSTYDRVDDAIERNDRAQGAYQSDVNRARESLQQYIPKAAEQEHLQWLHGLSKFEEHVQGRPASLLPEIAWVENMGARHGAIGSVRFGDVKGGIAAFREEVPAQTESMRVVVKTAKRGETEQRSMENRKKIIEEAYLLKQIREQQRTLFPDSDSHVPDSELVMLNGEPALILEEVTERFNTNSLDKYKDALSQYCQLNQAINSLGFTCSDRKPTDFYWIPDQKRLVVLDWNAVGFATDSRKRDELANGLMAFVHVGLRKENTEIAKSPIYQKINKYYEDMVKGKMHTLDEVINLLGEQQ